MELSIHPHLQRRWQQQERKLAFAADSVERWRAWRGALVRKLRTLIGYPTFEAAPLQPQVTEEVRLEGYLRQRVVIQTEPEVWMPFFALVPDGARGPLPTVIAAHGHSSGGKSAVAGATDIPEVAESIRAFNYDYGVQLVKRGFLVLCPDARGFGERQELVVKENPLTGSCQVINNMAMPMGQTVTGMWTWDLHRLLDYAHTRADCDRRRVGCAGLSGGGLQTLWATALDTQGRISCSVISGYLYGYKESLLDLHGNCSCNYVPHLYEHVDMGDIAALIAPRPLLVETGDKDPLNGASGVDNVLSQLDIVRRAYQLHGAEERLDHHVFPGEHRWHGGRALPFLERHLKEP